MASWVYMLLLMLFLGAMRLRRLAPGQPQAICENCSYSLAGLPEHTLCPECGMTERRRPLPRSRLIFFPKFGKLLQIPVVFVAVPILWALGNILGTTLKYASVESFTAAWRNASVGLPEGYLYSDRFVELLTPSCALLAIAVAIWPRRRAWLVMSIGLGLVAVMAYASGVSFPSWHRHPSDERPKPEALLYLFLLGSLALRFADLTAQANRWSLQTNSLLPAGEPPENPAAPRDTQQHGGTP